MCFFFFEGINFLPPGAVIGSVHQIRIFIIFGFFKVIKNVFVAPARVSQRFPYVVIFFISSHVEHVIEHARTSENFSPGPITTIVGHTCLKKKKFCLFVVNEYFSRLRFDELIPFVRTQTCRGLWFRLVLPIEFAEL